MSTQWMKQTLIASVLTVLMTLPALAQQRRAAAPAPGGPAKPAAGLPFEFKAATRQAAQKAQEAYKALLKARVTHLKATKALLVVLKGDLEKNAQEKQRPAEGITISGMDQPGMVRVAHNILQQIGGFSFSASKKASGSENFIDDHGNYKVLLPTITYGLSGQGDFDFNDVVLKLDTQIRNVQNSLRKIPYDKIRH